ncbi:pro-neuregulin-1, membrane-bound isoform isoform X4 [Pristis pectinata]|uniref:pro-neuregulin-1, membrane-bound isoform isoform X4 n=1 Tax=Pristis pectinata TaxID=685728 RepID=UPI00223CBFD1|nr:pro-neuregulin-1, membrane-bound isoform isoform X4 [Pristis pectinata]
MSEGKQKGRGKGKGKGKKDRKGPKSKEEALPASAPKIKPLKSDVVVNEGKKLVLRCEAISGYPQPTFTWYKDGKKLNVDKKSKEIRIKRKKRKESELLIRKVKPSHAGEYTCKAVNQQGEDQSISNIAVTPATTSPTPWSGHARPCNESNRHYCVNGGQCFVINGINKLSCQCDRGFTGERCAETVPMRVFIPEQAEELYQKRVLTITGICIAVLVVGIMCVVAYCKTKKQRKKLHDRLRQSLRSERNNMVNLVNGPHHANPPAENVQLANQYILKNPGSTEHVIERETETSFSTSHYTSTAHHSTTVTHTPSHSWSTGQTESVISDSHSVLVTSSIETSRQTSPVNHRGRLNGVAGRREMLICVRNSRDTPDSLRDSPHSERFVSAMTTPARMSPVDFRTPVSPKSPGSEMSPPVSSLTISMPSVPISPSIEEERPLLLVTPPRQREKRQDAYRQYRGSVRDSASVPASPQRAIEDDEYETTQEYELALEPPKKGASSKRGKRTKLNGQISHKVENESNPTSNSNSSDSETEDERIGEETPFLTIQNPMSISGESAPAYRLAENRTNSTNRYSAQEELQVRLTNVMANQDPIAV